MDKPLDPNLEAARLAARREALAAERERQEAKEKLIVLTPAERERVTSEGNRRPGDRIDPSKLKIKKEKRSTKPTTKQWADTGKTARNKKKQRDDSRKTNNPALSQSIKGKGGQKPNKNGKG